MPWTRSLVGLLLVAGTAARADEFSERFFDGLRERRLFGLAEGHCLDRLAADRLSPEQRAEFVVELSRTLAEHGRFVPAGDERDGLWNRAIGVLDDLLAERPPPAPAIRLRLEMQRAFVPAGLGEFLARQVEVQPFDAKLRDRAAGLLDDAIARLVTLEARLKGVRPTSEGPSTLELRSAEYNVRLRLAVTRLDRAGLLERTDPNRVGLLRTAEDAFRKLSGGDTSDPTTQRCHVFLARTWRMQGRAADAVRPLEALLSGEERLTTPVLDEVEAERAMILLVLGRPDEAAGYLVQYGKDRGRLPGELRFLLSRALVGLWQAARQLEKPDLATNALERLQAHVAATEQEEGGYWGVRCRILLENAVAASDYGAELAHVLREADGRFHSGETAAAVDGYARAIELATERDRPDLVFRFGFTRGSMLLDGGRFDEAAEQLHGVAERFPENERAARADLLAAYAQGRQYDAARTAESRIAYVDSLEAHRSRFPGSPTAGEAAWMLARLHERRLQYTDALKAYLAIPVGHDRGYAAAARAAGTFEAIVALLEQRNQPTDQWVRSARTQLGRVVESFPPILEPLNLDQARVAVALARWLVGSDPREYDKADELLERVSASWSATSRTVDADTQSTWRALAREAVQLRIVAMAGRGRVDDANRLVDKLAGADPETLLEVLDGLTAVLATGDADLGRRIGILQLAAAAPLEERRDELAPEAVRRLDVCLAEGYLATDQTSRAVGVYERLLAANPRDPDLQRTIAVRLTDNGRPEAARVAKPIWRRLERRAKEGSDEWFGHRYRVALCALRLGEFEECRKLLGVTRALHPGLGGPEWSRRFADLERSLAAADR